MDAHATGVDAPGPATPGSATAHSSVVRPVKSLLELPAIVAKNNNDIPAGKILEMVVAGYYTPYIFAAADSNPPHKHVYVSDRSGLLLDVDSQRECTSRARVDAMLEFVAQHPHALLRMHGISVVPNPHRANGLAARPRAAKADIKPLPGLSILSSCSTVLYTGTFTDKFDWQEVKDAAGEIVTVAGWEPQLESSVFTPAPIWSINNTWYQQRVMLPAYLVITDVQIRDDPTAAAASPSRRPSYAFDAVASTVLAGEKVQHTPADVPEYKYTYVRVVMFRGMRNLGRQIADMVDNQGYALLKAVNLEAGWWNEEKQLQIDDHSIMHFWSADLHDLQHQAPAALEHIRERHVHELVPIEGMLELLSPKQPLFECDADDKLVASCTLNLHRDSRPVTNITVPSKFFKQLGLLSSDQDVDQLFADASAELCEPPCAPRSWQYRALLTAENGELTTLRAPKQPHLDTGAAS